MRKKEPILFGPLPPPYGGVSIFMRALAARAAENGLRVWSYKGKPENDGGRQLNHRRFEHLTALLREPNGGRIIDSTHFHLEYPNKILLPLWLAAKKIRRFEWIKILHDGSLVTRYEKFGTIERKLFRQAAKNIDEFVVTGKELETWLREKIKVEQKVSLIEPLLPLSSGCEKELPDAELDARLARFARHRKRVCSVGIFISSYGFQHIAEAVEQLRRETGEAIGLFLVDGGFDADEKFRAQVLQNREWIEVAENVTHPNLTRVFRQSDVFVRGFAHESYGLSRIEALLSGTPVIATDAGETRGMAIYKFGDKENLLAHLRKILAGETVSDAAQWADEFRREAEENLRKYLRVIRGDESF